MKKKVLLSLIIVSIILIGGCEKKESNDVDMSTTTTTAQTNFITCDKKDELMKNKNSFLIDVRESDEFSEGHIDKAINISYTNIVEDIKKNKKITKDSIIIVYCRSGKRSTIAYDALVKEGYKNVYNLGPITACNK